LLALASPLWCRSAELKFNFDDLQENDTPAGFTNLLFGSGRPADWRIAMDEIPPMIPPATSKAPVVTRRPVLTQVAKDPLDQHYPLFVYQGETFDDFTLTTRFKITDGLMEQVAGIAFRIQNETNFYVIRANAIDNTLRFYKVVDGYIPGPFLGPHVPIARGVWHDLKIHCEGNQISASLDGAETLTPITDTTFSSGKIGYWTKSDSECYFADTAITYQPKEILAQSILQDLMTKYPRLHDLKIYMPDAENQPRVVAAKILKDVGTLGDKAQQAAIVSNKVFVAKTRFDVSVLLPLRDRNGDTMGAVAVTMDTFRGQTEESAINRALPIVQAIEERGKSSEEMRQ
jgi:hypothetical protein